MIALGVSTALAPARLYAQQPVPAPTPVPNPVPAPAPLPPTPPAAPPSPMPAYRGPTIALVQPPPGVVLPPDKAVLIFRFAPGEASDPVDASSFAVWVSGAPRNAAFQVGVSEAWGALGDPHATSPLAPGAYPVTARICSTKGACGTTSATVTVAASEGTPADVQGPSRRQRIIDLILAGIRRLVGP